MSGGRDSGLLFCCCCHGYIGIIGRDSSKKGLVREGDWGNWRIEKVKKLTSSIYFCSMVA